MLVPKECLITCIHIVSSTKLNKYRSLLFDLNDSHEETRVLNYWKQGPLDITKQIV